MTKPVSPNQSYTMSSSYSIAKAAQLSGLTTHLIRAWENRYSVVVPSRNDGGQRRYSDKDVERLSSLSRLVGAGYRIGAIASLTDTELAKLLTSCVPDVRRDYIDSALAATEAFDASSLESILNNAAEELGAVAVADQVIFPFMEELGRSWHEEKIRMMNEHMASTVVYSLLVRLLSRYPSSTDGPVVVVAILPGQQHNLGSVACALAAADAGFRVRYLGTHLPAQEILAAVTNLNTAALLMSIVFPPHTSDVKEAFDFLERELPESVLFVAGGVSAAPFISGGRGRAIKAPRLLVDLREFLAGFQI